MTRDSRRSFNENSLILLEIQSWCSEVVYIDEFIVSPDTIVTTDGHQR